ncbi:MAG TPA: ATP-dependent Clp protease proteolytic subunit [Thermaerobacter sp.]
MNEAMGGLLVNFFWFLVILWTLYPLLQQRRINSQRLQLIRRLEQERGSRVITLIHRQESLTLLGIPLTRYITVDDSEQVLRAIRYTPPTMPIDLIVHTPGGLVLAAEQIAEAIRRHRGPVTVMVPHYAMSGGTLIALAADEIWMDENAVLGPVDPQLGGYPAASILAAIRQKGPDKVDDRTLVLGDVAGKAMAQVRETVFRLLQGRMPEERARQLATALTEGRWTHDFPIGCDELRALGLEVRCGLPETVYRLMDLYPQPGGRRPSVQFIPVPYPERQGR